MNQKKQEYVYVVYGPSAEWADGVGVLGYAANEEDALDLLEWEKEEEEEYGPRSWRTIEDCGDFEPLPVEEFLEDAKAREAYDKGGLASLVEYLNQYV
jgi:hypothetical protein